MACPTQVTVIRAGLGERISARLGAAIGGEKGSGGGDRVNLHRIISRKRGRRLSVKLTKRRPSFRAVHGKSAIGVTDTPLL